MRSIYWLRGAGDGKRALHGPFIRVMRTVLGGCEVNGCSIYACDLKAETQSSYAHFKKVLLKNCVQNVCEIMY